MKPLGRDQELALIASAIHDPSCTVLTLEAIAGTGKSTILQEAAARAADEGVRVLSCHPTSAESKLAYAALGDLLDPISDLGFLPPLPRAALEFALLRGDGCGPIDERAVGSACVGAWRELASTRPLLLVIDDLQWLDAASVAALTFSLRRPPQAQFTVLAARRSGEPAVALPGRVLPIEPLTDQAITAILSRLTTATPDAGRSAPSGRRSREIVRAAAGNPLYAIELARHAARSQSVQSQSVQSQPVRRQPNDRLEVPPTLNELIRHRFDGLDGEVREALIAIALMTRPDLSIIRRLGLSDQIQLAEVAGVVESRSRRVVFDHPLLAAAVLDGAPSTLQRQIHRKLAAVLTGAEACRHSALAAEGPDEKLAADLAAIATGLSDRGAVENAADFAVLAAKLTPLTSLERAERHIAAAYLSFQSGEAETALSMLAEVDQHHQDRESSVAELLIRAKIAFSIESTSKAADLAGQALALSMSDEERIECHALLARVSYDHFPTAAEHAAIALEIAERCDVPATVMVSVLIASAGTAFPIGAGLDRQMYAKAIELERKLPVYASESALGSMAALLKFADELDEAREIFTTFLAESEDDGALPYALSHLPSLELWAGNWDAAEDYAARHHEAAVRAGQQDQVVQANFNLATVSLYRGDVADAAELAEQMRLDAIAEQDIWTERNGVGLLGVIAMADGDAEKALGYLDRWQQLTEQLGLADPGYRRLDADHVEAMVATGRLEDAKALADQMQLRAERLNRNTSRGLAQRALALVAAARGEQQPALSHAQESVQRLANSPLVVEHARALLTKGQIHRRFREKSAARNDLQAAMEIFRRLGAERFVERTRQDLARIGLRTPSDTGLTETERRVAELAGTGLTVRQVGDQLFISPKTVEANLTRVYRKLGISGRAALAGWLVDQQ